MKLKIAGAGRDLERLRALAGDNVEFLGFVPEAELPGLMAKCKALISCLVWKTSALHRCKRKLRVVQLSHSAAAARWIPSSRASPASTSLEMTVDSLKEVWRDFDDSAYNSQEIRAHARQIRYQRIS